MLVAPGLSNPAFRVVPVCVHSAFFSSLIPPLVILSGYGYGGGIRVDTPLGPLRLEYAWNKQRVGRFHVGVGQD